MRSEATMYQLFMDIAKSDDRILAVYMNGSRTNNNAPKDIFQDYDIVFMVTKTQPFIEDKNWICQFGNILYMQYPDEHPDFPSDKENIYGWLMQFDDGNRIDLHVSVGKSAKYLYRWLSEDEYQSYLNTYFGGNTQEAWDAVFTMCELFSRVTVQVAQGLGYTYPVAEEKAARAFLECVRQLPKNAAEIVISKETE